MESILIKDDDNIDLDIQETDRDDWFIYLTVTPVTKRSIKGDYTFGMEICKPPEVQNMTMKMLSSDYTITPVLSAMGWCKETGGIVFRLSSSSTTASFGKANEIRVPIGFQNITIYYGNGTGMRLLESTTVGYSGTGNEQPCWMENSTYFHCAMLDNGADLNYFNMTYNSTGNGNGGTFTTSTSTEFATTNMITSCIVQLDNKNIYVFSGTGADLYWTYKKNGNNSWSKFVIMPGFDRQQHRGEPQVRHERDGDTPAHLDQRGLEQHGGLPFDIHELHGRRLMVRGQ
jgi:hypothetical protein